jgi:hypothetical protein
VIVNPFAPPFDLTPFKPDLPVWTMRLTDDEFDGLLCSVAWTDEAGLESHHWRHDWFREDGRTVAVVEMTLRGYLRAHVREVKAMNPFYEAARMDFVRAWEAAHGPTTQETTP